MQKIELLLPLLSGAFEVFYLLGERFDKTFKPDDIFCRWKDLHRCYFVIRFQWIHVIEPLGDDIFDGDWLVAWFHCRWQLINGRRFIIFTRVLFLTRRQGVLVAYKQLDGLNKIQIPDQHDDVDRVEVFPASKAPGQVGGSFDGGVVSCAQWAAEPEDILFFY